MPPPQLQQPPPPAQSLPAPKQEDPSSAAAAAVTAMLKTCSNVDESTGRKYRFVDLMLNTPAFKQLRLTPRAHSLDVVQQPRRARMCGFGDKVTTSSLSA